MALNNRPVIYWVSQNKGIAFALASNGPRLGWTRSLGTIEVFRPGWKFQPHGCAWPGEWSPLPAGTIHLRHAKPNTRIALGRAEWTARAKAAGEFRNLSDWTRAVVGDHIAALGASRRFPKRDRVSASG